jgi:MFS family permease
MDTDTASAIQSVKKPGLLINRDFALLWSGRSISNLGDWIFDLTLVLWVATRIARGQPWAPLAVSGVFLATSLPTFIVGPIAGVFVDRWDKRHTMLWTDALRALLIAVLIPLPFLPGNRLSIMWQLGAIYVVVILATTCSQFFDPSRFALIGDLVAEPYRARASSLMQLPTNLARIVGPALAAPLFFGLGVQWALILNALSFVVSFLAILAVHAPLQARGVTSEQQPHVLREFQAGLRFFAGNRVLRTVLISVVLVVLGFGALNALNIFFVIDNLHAPASLYSLTTTAVGVGAVAGVVLAGLFAQRLGVIRMFWLSIVVLGIIVLAYALLTNFGLALVLLVLLGVPNAAVDVAIGPIVLHATPREYLGRISAVLTPSVSLATMLSLTLAGFLDSTLLRSFHATLFGVHWGPVNTIFAGTGLLTIIGGLYAMVNLRDVNMATNTTSDAMADEASNDVPA